MTKPKTLEQLRADKERDRDAACTGTAQVGASGEQKEVSGTGRTGRNFDRNGKDHAAQRGRDAFGTATRISTSLSRRLSAFFGSTHDQAPKAAKFAVLNPGHAGFPKRVVRSEGSDTIPTQNATCFAVCALVCNPVGKAEVYPLSPVIANVGRLWEKLKDVMKSGLEQHCDGNFLAIFA